MDSITQAALGVVVSEATFRRRIGKSANWLAALAAISPDWDTAARWVTSDPWVSLAFHRAATHSLLVAPLIALFWAGLFFLFRKKQFWPMFALALLAVLSHPLLDLMTSYGTQIFWPITDNRYAFDFLPIVDVIYTPILLLTIFGCWLARRIRSRSVIADPRRRSPVTAWIAIIGLALSTAYAGVGAYVDYATRQMARQTVPGDHGQIIQIRSGPLIGTVFARRIAVKTEQGYYVGRHNVLVSQGPPEWTWAPSDDGRWVQRADQLEHIRLFRWFAQGMARPVVEQGNGNGDHFVRVTYYDMRYGYPADSPRSLFYAFVIFDARSGEVVVPPTRARWADHEAAPEGITAFFEPPADGPGRGAGWARFKNIWQEAWRP